jgi:cobalt/nickel transport system ATP-binding protein
MKTALEVERLGFSFHAERPVLRDISFSIHERECVGIVGANGSGKSTLLWCVAGLLRASGSVRIFGERAGRAALSRIGMVFQNPEDQLFMPAVVDDVVLPLVNRGMEEGRARERALECLRQVGLQNEADRPAAQLSVGERKRASIAAALATSPRLLLLDEPTAELDGRAVGMLARVLAGLEAARVVTSHHIEFLRGLASRVLVLHDGGILAGGPAADILGDHDLLVRAGLEYRSDGPGLPARGT